MTRAGSASRGLLIVAAFQLALSLAVVSKPLDVDEPLYAAMAGQALSAPRHPGALRYFWEGRWDEVSRIVPSSPLPSFLYAPGVAAAGGDARRLRLCFVPVDVAAALLLYLLAGRFLKRPLVPTLAILAGPGWWLTVPALLLEKWVVVFGLGALYAASRADPRRPDRWWWGAAVLAALSALSKHSGIVFAAGAAALLARRGASPGRLAGWLLVALGPAGAYLASGALDPERLRNFALHARPAGGLGAAHRARAVLAFAAGGVPAAAVWAWATRAPRARLIAAAALGAAVFLPVFDLLPASPADRLLGAALGACAAAAACALLDAPAPGTPLWLGLGGSALAIEAFIYWTVTGRFSLLLSLALALALAERVERERSELVASRWAWAGLALSLAAGIPAAAADGAHARASMEAARQLAAPAVLRGQRVFYTGHWGFQSAMEAAGAKPLDAATGGWAQAGPGDRVIVPGVNANVRAPAGRLLADVSVLEVPSPVPLLVMCGARWRCQAGFHSSAYGFLPFSLTAEPADRFTAVDLRR
jgi:hypothetical protein